MKRIVIALGAIVLAGGCASSAPRDDIVVDDEKVAKIEAAARRQGIEVHWVQLPTKRVPAK